MSGCLRNDVFVHSQVTILKAEPQRPLLWELSQSEKIWKKKKILSWILRMFISVIPHFTSFCFQALSRQTYIGEEQILWDSNALFEKRKKNTEILPFLLGGGRQLQEEYEG